MPQDIRPQGYFPQGSFIIPSTEIERRRKLAAELAKTGGSGPVQHWTQGAARLVGALGSALQEGRANEMEQQRQSALAEALRSGDPDAMIRSGEPELQQVGQFLYQQQQKQAEAQRQAQMDAQKAAEQASNPPEVKMMNMADGSQVAVQWDRPNKQWIRFQAPQGGTPASGMVPQSTKPLTEGEVKQNIYTRRAAQSNDLLSANGADTALTDLTGKAASAAPGVLKPFANYMKTPAYKDAEQYGGEFITAILRQESQASVRPDEFEMYGNIYLPQPGDGPRDLERRQRARTRAVQDLQSGMASRDILLKELDLQRQENAAAPPLPSAGGAPASHPIQGAPAAVPDARAGEVPLPSAAAPQGGGYPKPTDPQSQQIPDALWNSWPPEIQQQWIQGK